VVPRSEEGQWVDPLGNVAEEMGPAYRSLIAAIELMAFLANFAGLSGLTAHQWASQWCIDGVPPIGPELRPDL